MLGYPDRASRPSEERDAHARRRSHPGDLGSALTMGATEFDRSFDHNDLRRRAEECERLGRENSLPFLWTVLAPRLFGQALIREGKLAEGIATLKVAITHYEATESKLRKPTLNALLAEAMALTGELDNALRSIDE